MYKLPSLKTITITVLLILCFTSSVYAEETGKPVLQSTTAVTAQIDNTRPETDLAEDTEEPAGNTLTTATPQPPLIQEEQKQETSYEPPVNNSTKDNDAESKQAAEDKPHDTDSERNIGNTPQPPLIDPQVESSYEPKPAEDKTQSTASDDTEPVLDQTPEPVPEQTFQEIAPTEPVPDEPIETDKQADEQAAETTGKEIKEEKEQQRKKWTETYPISINADWLQLKSGEWLRGRITIMQKEILEFDSDELNDLVIKWKNVKYLKSYEPYSLRFNSEGRTVITGMIEVTGDKVHVRTDYDDKVYDRKDLDTIASGKETEISYWKSKVTFSINVRKGNTEQTDFTSKITAKRRTTDSRLILDYLGNFTKVENTETINNHRFNETYDYFLTRDLYWTPLFTEIFRDPFQNIERRLSAGVGIGYSLINTHISEWNIAAGPAYQETKFVSVQSDTDKVDSTFALMLSTNFNTELNTKVDIEGLYNITLGDKETGGYTHHSLLTIETALTDKLDFDVTGVWDHVRKPVSDENGNTPAQDDFRIMIGLGYDL